jgi:hypothetical protein
MSLLVELRGVDPAAGDEGAEPADVSGSAPKPLGGLIETADSLRRAGAPPDDVGGVALITGTGTRSGFPIDGKWTTAPPPTVQLQRLEHRLSPCTDSPKTFVTGVAKDVRHRR